MKLFHYTTGNKLKMIIDSGLLRPTEEFTLNPSPTGKRIKPPVWLSKNETLEPAAIKPVMAGGVKKKLPVEKFANHFGLYRIQVKPSGKTLSFPRLVRAMGLPSGEARDMANAAVADGCDVSDWYGYIGKIKVKDFLSIEKYDDGDWIEIKF
ncbi:hypothetical protein [Vibrio crassostreae]|uniref:hypothetical protein n=1 Tax=Vibrio crassostreae TaxID=246167 RepID=UPI001B30A2EC|nr:hypothetical protein [Vibrio crassostreae]